jgi:phosphatidylinositol-3-phosphatase
MRRFGAVLALLTVTMTVALTGCASTQTPPPSAATPTTVRVPASATVTKVLVFVEENHSLAEMKTGMPYTFGLAQQFGYATKYTAIGHPSLPNYVAITGGQTYGITDDNSPAVHRIGGASVFGQAIAAGKTAAVYADGMPNNCATTDGGTDYAVKHNPWAYYTTERAECQKHDVPITQLANAITKGQLPNVGMVVPNLCNDAHNCPLSTADAWFKGWMTKIFAGPDWKSGHLAIVLTADEDDKSAGNTVLTAVIHPSQKANVVATPLTHYSLTGLYEDVAGVPYLFNAATAPSMATAFGLPVPSRAG